MIIGRLGRHDGVEAEGELVVDDLTAVTFYASLGHGDEHHDERREKQENCYGVLDKEKTCIDEGGADRTPPAGHEDLETCPQDAEGGGVGVIGGGVHF